MAIDLNKMRAKLEALKNRGNRGEDGPMWKPKEGEQAIRIVPTPDGDPFKEFWLHYNLGKNRGFLSPKRNFGIDDPLNDFVRQLFNEKTDESIKMAKKLMAKQRFYAPVLVRGEEEKGVRWWSFGKKAYQQLLNLVLNPEYGDITDIETGTDIVLKYTVPAPTPPGQPRTEWPETILTPRRRSSVLCDDAVGGSDRCAELLDNIPNLDDVFIRKTPEEIQVMLDEWLSGDSEGKDDVVKYDNQGSTTSVDAAFNELMNA